MQFDPTTLLGVANRIAPAPGLVTQLLVGDKIVYAETNTVDQDFYMSTKKLAPFVSRKMGGKVISHTQWDNYQFVTPKVAARFPLDDDLLERRMPGEPVVGGMSPTEREDAWQAQKIAEAKVMNSNRIEWMGATYLSTGLLTLEGEGYTDEIDLGHTNNETLAAGVKWDTAAGEPLADLERWQLGCLADSGVAPNICVMGTSAAGAFLSNEKVLKAFSTNANYVVGRIDPKVLPAGARYLGYLSSLDIEVYVHGGQYENDSSVMTPYVAVDRVVLFPSADRNSAKLVYGPVRDAKLKQWFPVDLYPRMVTDEDANTSFIETISRPLLVFVEIDSFYWADVV